MARRRPPPQRVVEDLDARLRKLGLASKGLEGLAEDFGVALEEPAPLPPVAELLKAPSPEPEPVPQPPPEPPPAAVEPPLAAEPEARATPPPPPPAPTPPPPPPAPMPPPPEPLPPPPVEAEEDPRFAPSLAALEDEEESDDVFPKPPGHPPPAPPAEAPAAQGPAEDPVPQAPPAAPLPPEPESAPRRAPAALTLAAAALLAAAAWGGIRFRQAELQRRAHGVFELPFPAAAHLLARDGRLYTVDSERGLVFAFSSDELKTEAIRRLPGGASGGLAWGDGCVWSSDPDGGEIRQLGADGGFALRRSVGGLGGSPTLLAWDGRHLWAVDAKTRSLREYAAADGLTLLRELPLPGAEPAALHASGGLLWLAERNTRRVRRLRIGPAMAPYDTIDLGSWLPADAPVAGFAVDGSVLWVLTSGPSRVHRLDWRRLERSAQVPGGLKQ